MNRAKWTLSLGREYNQVADLNLRRYIASDLRAAYRRGSLVASPAAGVLAFAYVEPPLKRSGTAALARVRSYSPRGLERAAPAQFHTTSERDLARVQEQVRSLLASLLLKPTVEDPVNPRGYSKIPAFTARMHLVRSGPYGLGPDFENVRPPWIIDVIRSATVLLDAIPWLRYCALCGRVFFKVKRRRVCGRRCGVVVQSRRRWARSKKGDRFESRGRPRTDYSGPVEAAHQEWVRSITRRGRRLLRR